MKKYIIAMAAMTMVASAFGIDDGRAEAAKLLSTWCDGMIAHQLDFPKDKSLDGGMVCPGCGFLHGRICDAVYGFVVEWQLTGDEKYLKAAERAVNWTEANMLRPDGFYKNDEQSTWWYTTVFSQIAFYKTLTEFGDKLPAELKAQWRAIYARQSDWLYHYFLRPEANPVVNYWGNFAEAMAEAGEYLGVEKYTAAAKDMLAQLDKVAFTPENLLKGEGHPLYEPTKDRGNFRVDFGYNLEETMPALLNAAVKLGDKAFEAKVMASIMKQVEVLLPDGAIDNSMGARSSKWTYTGSRTSDGILPLLADLEARGVKWARRAAKRVIAQHQRQTCKDGLLAGGIHYEDADEPPCIHHTFTHVKAVAEWLERTKVMTPAEKEELMPREITPRLVEYPSMSTYLAGIGPWRATFSASDAYVSPNRKLSVGGGSPTLLWHEKAGPVLAATQYEFVYVEPTNQQDQRHDTYVLTANSRIVSPDGKFSNVCDWRAMTVGEMDHKKEVFSYKATGRLTDLDGKQAAPFDLAYRLDRAGYTAKVKTASGGRYYFPIVAGKGVKVDIAGNRALISYPEAKIEVRATKPISLQKTERGERAFTIVGGFMTAQLYIELGENEESEVTIGEAK